MLDALQREIVPTLSNTHSVKEGEWISVYGKDPDGDNYIDEICDTLEQMGTASFNMKKALKKLNPAASKVRRRKRKAEVSSSDESGSDESGEENDALSISDDGICDADVEIPSTIRQSALPLSAAMNDLFIYVQNKFAADTIVRHWNTREPWVISFGEAISNILLKDNLSGDPVSLLVFDAGFMLNVVELMTHYVININADSDKAASPPLRVQCFESCIELCSELISKLPVLKVNVELDEQVIEAVRRVPECTINTDSKSVSLSFAIANSAGIYRQITFYC